MLMDVNVMCTLFMKDLRPSVSPSWLVLCEFGWPQKCSDLVRPEKQAVESNLPED